MKTIFSVLVFLLPLIFTTPASASNLKVDSISSLIKSNNDPIEIAKLQLELAWAKKYENLGSAIKITQNAISVLKENKEYESVAIGQSYMGVFKYINKDLASSIQYLKKSELFFTDNKNDDRLARVYNNLGVTYSALNDNNKALEYYNKCLEIKKKNIESTDITTNLINIATIYYDQGKYQKCIEANEQALVLALQKNNYESISIIYANLGAAHERIGKYQISINYALKALDIYQNNFENNQAETRTYSNLGATYMSQNMLDEARHYFTLAIEINQNSEAQKAVSLNNMAELERISKNLDLARTYALSALDIVTNLNYNEEKLVSLTELYLIEEDSKRYKLALDYYVQYITLSDSIMEISNSQNTQIALAQNQLTLNLIHEKKTELRENIQGQKVDIMIWFFWIMISLIVIWVILFVSEYSSPKVILLGFNFIISFLFLAVSIMYLFLKTSIITENGKGVLFLIFVFIILFGTIVHMIIDSKVNNK